MQATIIKTFKQGGICAALLEFTDEPSCGFHLWRWLRHDSSKSPSTHTFQVFNLDAVATLLERVSAELEAPPFGQGKKPPMEFTPRLIVGESPLHSRRIGEVLLTIHDGKKSPWVLFRRVVSSEPLMTANWFLASDIDAVRQARAEAAEWCRAASADAA